MIGITVSWNKRDTIWAARFKRLDDSWGSKNVPRKDAPTLLDEGAAKRWAEAWYENYLRNGGVTRGEIVSPPPPAKTTLSEWSAWLRARYENPNIKGATYAQNESYGRIYILTHKLASLPIKDWKPEHAKEFVIWVREESGLSSSSQGNLIFTWSAFMSSQSDLLANPFHHQIAKAERSPRKTAWGQGSPPHIESRFVPAFLTCPGVPVWRRVKNAMAVLGGCREGELQGLRWGSVDLLHAIPHYTVSGQLSARVKDGLGSTTVGDDAVKTKTSFRLVPLHPFALEALRTWFDTGWAEWVGREPDERDYLFPRKTGEGFRPHCAPQVRRDCRAAGIPDTFKGHSLTEHSLRRTFSTLLHEAGVPMSVVDEVLGHTKGSVAASSYVQISLIPYAEVIRKIVLDFGIKKDAPPPLPSGFAAMRAEKLARKQAI